MPEIEQKIPKKQQDLLKKEGIVIAFDYGLARIGVAVGNSVSSSARPLKIIHWKTTEEKWSGVSQVIEEWKPAVVIVGVPRHKDGNPNDFTQQCLKFANQIRGRFGIYVIEVDERFSSTEAHSQSGNQEYIDDIAAQVILEQWFKESFFK